MQAKFHVELDWKPRRESKKMRKQATEEMIQALLMQNICLLLGGLFLLFLRWLWCCMIGRGVDGNEVCSGWTVTMRLMFVGWMTPRWWNTPGWWNNWTCEMPTAASPNTLKSQFVCHQCCLANIFCVSTKHQYYKSYDLACNWDVTDDWIDCLACSMKSTCVILSCSKLRSL